RPDRALCPAIQLDASTVPPCIWLPRYLLAGAASKPSPRHSTACWCPTRAGSPSSTPHRAEHGNNAVPDCAVGPHVCGNRTGRSARHGRSTRPRDGHGTDRQKPSGLGAAGGRRLGKIRTGPPQNFIGLAQFPVLPLQRLDAFALFGGRAWTLACVGLMTANPAMQRLRGTTNLRRDGFNGGPLGWVVVQMLQNHAHGTFTDFRGVGRSLFHGLIFSRVEASTKPGAIQ